MSKVKALVVHGLGIGCHAETVKAYQEAGADAELIHFNSLLEEKDLASKAQVLNFSGGFLHGDILGSAMCAVNLIEHSVIDGKTKLQDLLWDFSEKGNVVYGQCNGFQLLVKSGLLPAIEDNYSEPVLTLADNDCGSYRVDYVPHVVNDNHFAFSGLEDDLFYLWCRHGEGKIQFSSDHSVISHSNADEMREKVKKDHVLLSYADPKSSQATNEFPYNPNGSDSGIAGLKSSNGRVFGHMAHPEVSVYEDTNPDWFKQKEIAKRNGTKIDESIGLKIFKNIVSAF